jgi:hypothetical protein
MKWHDSKTGYTKILEVEHNFPHQTVMRPPGGGKGLVNVVDGVPQPHACVTDVTKYDDVWQVTVGDGYFMITLRDPKRWSYVMGDIGLVIARHINQEKI